MKEKFALIHNSNGTLKNKSCRISKATTCPTYPAAIVNSVDDDISEMWNRLDEKYGAPAKVADVIIDGIRRTRIIREGEEKRFVQFVEIVEDGYRDLKRLGLESEITTASSVSTIEKKLPADIRRKWAEIVSADNSIVDKTNKFPSLLKFLRSQRGAIEYDTASLRVPAGPVKALIHHTTAKEEIDIKDQRMTQGKCLIHEGGKCNCQRHQNYLVTSLQRHVIHDKLTFITKMVQTTQVETEKIKSYSKYN